MNIKKSVKLSLTVFSFAVLIIGVFYLQLISRPNTDKSGGKYTDSTFGWKFPVVRFPSTGADDRAIAYSDIRDPGGIPQGLPMRLKIPVIGVDSAIEDAFITPDGRMDVPEGSVNVAWFALGPHPGQIGSAVIGGHFGIDNGVPKVFYNLDKLKIGDKVYIVDDNSQTLAFAVRAIRTFDRNSDATPVFTSSDGLSHLNLITCEGVWNQVNDSYPERLVVFTNSIPSEGEVSVPKFPLTAASPIATATPQSAVPAPTPQEGLGMTIGSLYATPLDALVTSFLLISIAFVVFKIIRRNAN